MCLTRGTTEKDPRQGSPLRGEAMGKDWPKIPSDHQLQEAGKKDSDRAITSVAEAEAVHMPAYLAPPESLQAKQLHHLHAQLPLEQSIHRQKSLVSMHTGSLWMCLTLCDPVDCGLPGFSVREEGSLGNYTGVYWPKLVSISF